MHPFDRDGFEGRWVDVPRLQAQSPESQVQSGFWDGRASAAMIYNFHCKVGGKASDYVAIDEGDKHPGPHGAKLNLRFGGGSAKGKCAGLDDGGKIDVQGLFLKGGLKVDGGSFVKPNEQAPASQAEKYLRPILEQLKQNNPVLIYTAFTRGEGGHIVVVNGYKKTRQGELWLRIVDPDAPRTEYLSKDYRLVTPPAGPEARFSEYWLRAARLFAPHPTQPPKRFYSYTGNWGRYLFVLPEKPVADTHETVHKLVADAGGEAPEPEAPAPAPAGKMDAAAAKKGAKPAAKEEGEAGGEEEKPAAKKEEKKESGRPVGEIEAEALAGEYKEAGKYEGGKFKNKDLQKLLEHYCQKDGIDPAAKSEREAKQQKGGDFAATATEELPLWYSTWRKTVSTRPKWDTYCIGRSRIGEAFSRWFFRKMCKDKGVDYPASADEFFANLWKSNINKKSPDMGGPSSIYCAAACSLGVGRATASAGWEVPSTLGFGVLRGVYWPKPDKYKIQPGDVLTIVSPQTPRNGHICTCLLSLGDDPCKGGEMWIVSGNSGPGGTVAVDFLSFEPTLPYYKHTTEFKWGAGEKKPNAGKTWLINATPDSLLMPGKLDSLDKSKLKAPLRKIEPKVTPGSKPGKYKEDDAGGDEAPPEEKKEPGKEKKDGAAAKKKDEAKGEEKEEEKKGDEGGGEKPEEKKKEPKQKAKNEGEPPPPACPPLVGVPRLPITVNDTLAVSGEALAGLYHQAERGNGGYFPFGDSGVFHCGVHLMPESGKPAHAIAEGEVVAARNGGGPGTHAWGDTGFVITRHKVKAAGAEKVIYSLFMHLKKEALHPDRTEVGWLRRLLIAAMGGEPPKKTKWRVIEKLPTWTDEDKGKFSPTTVKNDKLLDPGVYEEEEQVFLDHKNYVKLKGKWVRGSGGAGDEGRIKEMSPWSAFDIETAAKNSAVVKALHEGKVAVLDTDKKDDKRRWRCESGEPVGTVGNYYGAPTLHWSIFSKDPVFPTGSLLDEEWGVADEVKLKDLDISSKDVGTPDQGKALVEALDPEKKVFGKEKDESVVQPTELRKFYRTPTMCWRARYQAIKGVSDFKIDLDKFIKQDKYKSHSEDERTKFKENAKPLVFWDDLSSAEDFPTDGKAVFVHPVTALRLMAGVGVAQDQDDPKELPGGLDRLHADEDVVITMRDKSGPLAAVTVTIKADGKVVKQAKTDAAGELVVQLEDLAGKDIELSVGDDALGKDGQVAFLLNETGGKRQLAPGDAPGNQSFNGKDVVPEASLDLPMRVKKGAKVIAHRKWNEKIFKPEEPIAAKGLPEGREIAVERIVFRRADAKFEAIETHLDGTLAYLWSIEDGKEALEAQPRKEGMAEDKEPRLYLSWSHRVAQVSEHPVLAGRVKNIDAGKEVEVQFFAMRSLEGAEHDAELETKKVKVEAGGLSVDFDPAQLVHGQNLLNSPRPVYAKIKIGDQVISNRDQAVTIYAAARPFQDPKAPPPPEPVSEGKPVHTFFEIARAGAAEKLTLFDASPATTRKLAQLGEPVRKRFVGEGGFDDVYVGTLTTMPHLALEAEARMKPAEALEQHKRDTLKSQPDAPAWAFSTPGRAGTADNGIQVGLCATHCKTEVCAEGKASGCTEEIRVRNLSSCHTAHHGACQGAVEPVKLGKKPVVKSCGGYAGSCAEARHDKSKCFLADPVLGDLADDRERWAVALPMRVKNDKAYDYKGRLRVVLVNPQNGKAVVCSQELRGPNTKSEGHDECAAVSVKKDELKGKGRLVACSYEVAWRLGMSRAQGGDLMVLLAFVPTTTPLGPVNDASVFMLRKSATFTQLISGGAIPDKLEPPPAPPRKKGAEAPPPSDPPSPKVKRQPVPEPDAPPPAPSGTLAPARAKMVAIARGELGKVDDRGGEGGKRKGWERLKEYIEKACGLDAGKQGWTKALQTPGQRAGGLHWCGIMTVWCAQQAGIAAKWKLGQGVLGMGRYRTDRNFQPGDVLVCKGALNHHCILTAIEGDKLETVNGNSYYQGITLATRSPGEIALYYRLSEQIFE